MPALRMNAPATVRRARWDSFRSATPTPEIREYSTVSDATPKRSIRQARALLGLRLHVAAGGGLDGGELGVARRLARGDLGAAVRRQPGVPRGPPAARHLLRRLEPALRVGVEIARPVVALVLRGRVDHPRDVPARTEHEDDLAADQLRALERGLPRHDVVFLR